MRRRRIYGGRNIGQIRRTAMQNNGVCRIQKEETEAEKNTVKTVEKPCQKSERSE